MIDPGFLSLSSGWSGVVSTYLFVQQADFARNHLNHGPILSNKPRPTSIWL
jgi:hypothetical protein